MMTVQTRKTLKWDLFRSIPQGVLESIMTTFGVLVMVRVFEGDQYSKAAVVAAWPTGLLVSLFFVQWVRRSGMEVGRAMAGLNVLAAVGFALIAFGGENQVLYVAGNALGAVGMASCLPLMSQVYRMHYPDSMRGKLFAYGGFARKVFAIATALIGGWYLRQDLENYRYLFGAFMLACLMSAGISLQFGPVHLDRTKTVNLFHAFRHVKTDHEFRHLLISWMVLGIGNLLGMALFVEYISNRSYGYDLDEFQIGLITTFVPEASFFLVIMIWGRLFDRWNFYLLRATINLFFAAGIIVYFSGHGLAYLITGISLWGIAKAGGNVCWSLWVTKFSKPEHVAEYMSVHTSLTGVRGISSPFIAFPLAVIIGPTWIGIIGGSLILVATAMIAPKIRFETKRRDGQQVEPDPRA